jgi:AcrR family transcriptional regulator
MAVRQRHRTERTREAFLLAARDVLGEKGYSACSVSDVVALAGRAHGTFYLHFDNKRDIFAALLPKLTHSAEQCVAATEPAADRDALVDVLERYCAAMVADHDLWVLLDEMAATESGPRALKADLRQLVETGVGRALELQFPADADDRGLTVELVAGMLLWIARTGRLPASPRVTAEHLGAIALRAVRG